MKTIDLPQASPEVASLLEQARDDDLILRLADGSEFLVVAIDDFDEEIARTRNNPRLMALLEARAKRTATIPLDEVKQRLGLVEPRSIRARTHPENRPDSLHSALEFEGQPHSPPEVLVDPVDVPCP